MHWKLLHPLHLFYEFIVSYSDSNSFEISTYIEAWSGYCWKSVPISKAVQCSWERCCYIWLCAVDIYLVSVWHPGLYKAASQTKFHRMAIRDLLSNDERFPGPWACLLDNIRVCGLHCLYNVRGDLKCAIMPSSCALVSVMEKWAVTDWNRLVDWGNNFQCLESFTVLFLL